MGEFVPIVWLLGVAGALVLAGYGLSALVAVQRAALDVSPFTGGLPPVEHAVSRFHVRWYPLTMVFLAFDMEMLFMYPWTLVVSRVGRARGDRDVPVPGDPAGRGALRVARGSAAMDLTALLLRARRRAPARAVVPVPGGTDVRLAVEAALARRGWPLAQGRPTPTSSSSPARPGPRLAADRRGGCGTAVPRRGRGSRLTDPAAVGAPLDAAAAVLGDTPRSGSGHDGGVEPDERTTRTRGSTATRTTAARRGTAGHHGHHGHGGMVAGASDGRAWGRTATD